MILASEEEDLSLPHTLTGVSEKSPAETEKKGDAHCSLGPIESLEEHTKSGKKQKKQKQQTQNQNHNVQGNLESPEALTRMVCFLP